MGVQEIELMINDFFMFCFEFVFTIDFMIVVFIILKLGLKALKLYQLADGIINLFNGIIICIWTVREIIPRLDIYIPFLANDELVYITIWEIVLFFILFHTFEKL